MNNLILPEGGMDLEKGVVFFYKDLPQKLSSNTPVLTESNGEIYAVVDNKIAIPVEKIPLKKFIKEDGGYILLAKMNSETFMAEVKFGIELQKETILELFGIIKAKNLLEHQTIHQLQTL